MQSQRGISEEKICFAKNPKTLQFVVYNSLQHWCLLPIEILSMARKPCFKTWSPCALYELWGIGRVRHHHLLPELLLAHMLLENILQNFSGQPSHISFLGEIHQIRCREAAPYRCEYVSIPFSRQQGPAYSDESHLEQTILDRCNNCAASPGMAADECEIDPPRRAAKHLRKTIGLPSTCHSQKS